jgi:site-specific recombinase XerD
MQTYQDCPQVLREFLSYHETIKGQSKRTVSEYYLDIRMFLRFVKLMRNELPVNTPLEDVPIKDVDLDFVRSISSTEVFDFLSFLANDRVPEGSHDDPGIGSAARARKLSAIMRSCVACTSTSDSSALS